ncbi:MAG: UDP-N-acetylmuramoyl-tripeptide--D-alanyl-D-alanine ligase [Chitinophagaceae bacterium]|nr:UDP-N-acetylmuramoyl-tripeptide--D-alanyl-D-alanine ligase [Chitinophagaceae bacterium]
MEITALYDIFLRHPGIQTDTRKIIPGDLFFALKGPNFNGNQFALTALKAGAAYAIVDEPAGENNDRVILVDDVLSTLQNLAHHHRRQFLLSSSEKQIPFIAITGSNGKTTSKELIHAVLSTTYKTYTTEGNLNNHIGIPLTLLKIKPDVEMAIIEMGANHQLEIAGYCEYCMPTHGVITNCGKAHLEGFGGEEGIRKGKGELFDYLRRYHGTAFVMWNYSYLREMSKGIPAIIRYGTTEATITGSVISSAPFLQVSITGSNSLDTIKTNLVGEYNLPNVLLAVTIGKYFEVPDEKIKSALENYLPANSRSQLIEKEGNKIILDAYNANPTSMAAAIENFSKLILSAGTVKVITDKVLMLGGMMELGLESIAEHQKLIELINKNNWKQVVLVGGDFKQVTHNYTYFENAEQARDWFIDQHFQDTVILIKGSRSTNMEKVLE